uniref:Late embryogenesis abundant protein LEA-2 subgroup domain-containing protein n=1 Tax=Salix viminalis TaxID=40686 RepID=A0A6N2MP82_SALVM
MPDSGGGGCCRCCCSFIFTSGLTALFMWLSLRTTSPACALSKFYIPLDQTKNLTTLEFELRLKNTNKDKGVYYDPINVTVFDSPNRSRLIGSSTITKFYQGHKKKATKNGTIPNISRDEVSRAAPGNGSTVFFWVDLAISVRYKILMFKTKRNKIRVGASVEVNGTISKVYPKDIKLKSNADKIRSYCGKLGVFFANFLVLGLLIF